MLNKQLVILVKAKDKVAIPNKYTNEARRGDRVGAETDPIYLSQIIARIE